MLDIIANLVGKDALIKVIGLSVVMALIVAPSTYLALKWTANKHARRQYEKQYKRITEHEPLTITNQSRYQRQYDPLDPQNPLTFPATFIRFFIQEENTLIVENLSEFKSPFGEIDITVEKFKDYFVYSNKPCKHLINEIDSPDIELKITRMVQNLKKLVINADQMALKTRTPIQHYTKLWNELMLRLRSLLRIRLNHTFITRDYVTVFGHVLQVITDKMTNPFFIEYLFATKTNFDSKTLERISWLEKIKMVGLSITIEARDVMNRYRGCSTYQNEINISSEAKRPRSSTTIDRVIVPVTDSYSNQLVSAADFSANQRSVNRHPINSNEAERVAARYRAANLGWADRTPLGWAAIAQQLTAPPVTPPPENNYYPSQSRLSTQQT